MILDASWVPKAAKPMFVTAGRDKHARVWSAQTGGDGKLQFAQVAALPCSSPVTAVDVSSTSMDGTHFIALGTETGHLKLYALSENGSKTVELPLIPE